MKRRLSLLAASVVAMASLASLTACTPDNVNCTQDCTSVDNGGGWGGGYGGGGYYGGGYYGGGLHIHLHNSYHYHSYRSYRGYRH